MNHRKQPIVIWGVLVHAMDLVRANAMDHVNMDVYIPVTEYVETTVQGLVPETVLGVAVAHVMEYLINLTQGDIKLRYALCII